MPRKGEVFDLLLPSITLTPTLRPSGESTKRIASGTLVSVEKANCTATGASAFRASIHRVAAEYARSSPELAEEFALASSECDAGVSLTEALRRMSNRVVLDDMTGLCAVIAQANELGAPIVETLAEYADSARKLRMAKLEEWAGKLAMKMLFPLALFLLPAAMVIMLGPSMMAVVSAIQGF